MNIYTHNSVNFDEVEIALFGTLKERKRIYPAHYVALDVVRLILLPLAGHEFMLTREHVADRLEVSPRSARSAIRKLLESGVLVETMPYRRDPQTKTHLARRFKLDDRYYTAEKPTNHWDGIAAYVLQGGTSNGYTVMKRSLGKQHSTVTVTMVLDALAEIHDEKLEEMKAASHFGGPNAVLKVI